MWWEETCRNRLVVSTFFWCIHSLDSLPCLFGGCVVRHLFSYQLMVCCGSFTLIHGLWMDFLMPPVKKSKDGILSLCILAQLLKWENRFAASWCDCKWWVSLCGCLIDVFFWIPGSTSLAGSHVGYAAGGAVPWFRRGRKNKQTETNASLLIHSPAPKVQIWLQIFLSALEKMDVCSSGAISLALSVWSLARCSGGWGKAADPVEGWWGWPSNIGIAIINHK